MSIIMNNSVINILEFSDDRIGFTKECFDIKYIMHGFGKRD